MTPAVLAIGGLDPSGSAGLLADVEAIGAAGGRAMAIATAWTIQSRRGPRGYEAVNVSTVTSQLQTLREEESIAAVKLGMLGSETMARALAEALRGWALPIVIDPVLVASNGLSLFEGDARAAYSSLVDGRAILTPNLAEAALLAGGPVIDSIETMRTSARALAGWGSRAVLVKGGHFPGAPVDLLTENGNERTFREERLPAARGTGCRLASALATLLARGVPLEEAVRKARAVVQRYLVT